MKVNNIPDTSGNDLQTARLRIRHKNITHRLRRWKERIHFQFRTNHRKGFGIHSPYLYRFITVVLQNKYPYYCFKDIENRADAATTSSFCPETTLWKYPGENTPGETDARQTQKNNAACRQILFRIIQDARFENLLEIGASTGLETLYMQFANPKARCVTATDSPALTAILQRRFYANAVENIYIQTLDKENNLENITNSFKRIDFVLFNRVNTEQLWEGFHLCQSKRKNNAIFAVLDIHKNADKARVWKNIQKNEDVRVTIDLYHMGIILFHPELQKKAYTIKM